MPNQFQFNTLSGRKIRGMIQACLKTDCENNLSAQPTTQKIGPMKNKIILLVGATTVSCLPLLADNVSTAANNNTVNANNNTTVNQPDGTVSKPLMSQDTQLNDRTQRDRDEYNSGKMDRLGDLRKANKIIGTEITDDQGQKLGKVKDLALDLQNGRIVEVIMATGGVLGMDQKLIAVPPSSFTCDKTMNTLRLNLDKDQLKNAPEFKTADWTTATQNDQIRATYQRYGVQPYFAGRMGMSSKMDMNNPNDRNNPNYSNDARSQGISPQDKLAQDQRGNVPDNQNAVNGNTATTTANQDTTVANANAYNNANNPGISPQDKLSQGDRGNVPGNQNTVNGNTDTTAQNQANNHSANDTLNTGLSPQDKLAQDQRGNIPGNQNAVNGVTAGTGDYAMDHAGVGHHNWRHVTLGYVASANHLMGTTAMNEQNEKLGKINNFIVDLQSGRVVEVIVASGGFLGIDQELSAVPPQSFRWNADNSALTLDTTRDNLKTSPHFKNSEWGYATQPATVTEVYSVYRVPAYFNNETEVDNTRQNVRDRSGDTLTPMSQGNSQSDISTTAQIRKAVVADASLSTNAKNVKIITLNGKVTLRGVVNSQQEKDTIANDAANVAQESNVSNHLRVRGETTNNESPSTQPTSTGSTDSAK
jgi:sporulation protein YlmC with PRC-barrel domain